MNNWKTGKRIGTGFGVTIALTLILGLLAQSQLRAIRQAATAITANVLPGVYSLGQLQTAIAAHYGLMQEYVTANLRNSIMDDGNSPEERRKTERRVSDLASSNRSIETMMDQVGKTASTPEDQTQFKAIVSARAPYVQCFDDVVRLSREGKHKDALLLIDQKLQPLHLALANAIDLQVRASKRNGDSASKDILGAVSSTSTAILFCLVLSIAIGVSVSVLVTRSIAVPLSNAVFQLDEIAKGDLSKDVAADLLPRGDEIGSLARSMQSMITSLRGMIQEVSGGIRILSDSSSELTDRSGQMADGSQRASDKAHSVSSSADQMSSGIATVAEAMGNTTRNLSDVADATEQMTSTINEIAGNSEKARMITSEATRQAAEITQQISELGKAAHEIGRVTEAITEISSQTNLLALNATIEAARAGTAGKGFAVVATEIKALAQQTANATEDIKARIAGVQAATAGGINQIGKISRVIHDVTEIVGSIAAAIEEQSSVAKEIARNIAEASSGVSDANERVSQTSGVSREIARDMVDVDTAAGEMAGSSRHVRSSAAGLAKVAEQLTSTVARYHS